MPLCQTLQEMENSHIETKSQPAGCTRMFCEYAKEFLAAMQKVGGEMDHEDGELEGWRMPENCGISQMKTVNFLWVCRNRWSWL